MSDTKRGRLDAASKAFTYVFLAECCLKLLGYGAAGFCEDGMNVFDGVVVALSLVDLFASVSCTWRCSTLPLWPLLQA